LISRSLCDLLAAGFARVDVEDTALSNLDVIQNALAGDRDVHGEPVSLTAETSNLMVAAHDSLSKTGHGGFSYRNGFKLHCCPVSLFPV